MPDAYLETLAMLLHSTAGDQARSKVAGGPGRLVHGGGF